MQSNSISFWTTFWTFIDNQPLCGVCVCDWLWPDLRWQELWWWSILPLSVFAMSVVPSLAFNTVLHGGSSMMHERSFRLFLVFFVLSLPRFTQIICLTEQTSIASGQANAESNAIECDSNATDIDVVVVTMVVVVAAAAMWCAHNAKFHYWNSAMKWSSFCFDFMDKNDANASSQCLHVFAHARRRFHNTQQQLRNFNLVFSFLFFFNVTIFHSVIFN